MNPKLHGSMPVPGTGVRTMVAAFALLAALGLLGLDRAAAREEAARTAASVARPRAPLLSAGYADSLRDAGVDLSAWRAAAARADSSAVTIEPPYVEVGRFPADRTAALGYRLQLFAGEKLRIEATLDIGSALFLDLYAGSRRTRAKPLASLAAPGVLEFAADRDVEVVAILQPALGAETEYGLTISRVSPLLFPVQDSARARIAGHYADPRDGGTRRHRGIDIHAPRGTNVVAVADGTVSRVETTELGGRVVWLRDARSSREYYYAHLQKQLVHTGQKVRAGDVLGTVGTTGNAADAPPHLHFGIYRGGRGIRPVDPERLLAPPDSDLEALSTREFRLLGASARTQLSGAALRRGNDGSARAMTLPRQTRLDVLAATGRYYRVRQPDGTEGFVAGWLLEPTPRKH